MNSLMQMASEELLSRGQRAFPGLFYHEWVLHASLGDIPLSILLFAQLLTLLVTLSGIKSPVISKSLVPNQMWVYI